MIKYNVNSKMRPRPGYIAIYQKLGIDFEVVKDVRQLRCNPTTADMLRYNVCRWVARKYPFLSSKKKESMVSLDALGYSPMTDYDVPDGEIWVDETL